MARQDTVQIYSGILCSYYKFYYRNAFVGMENIHEIALSDKKTNRRTCRPPNSLHVTFECHHNCGSLAKGLRVGLLGLTPAAAGSDLYFFYAYCCSCPKMYLCSFYPELQYGIEDKIDEALNPESYVKRRCWATVSGLTMVLTD